MKKVLPLLVLIGACNPDIPQEGPPPASVSPLFDLTKRVVPLPNDLARDPTTGKIVVPPSPTDTAAQREFNEKYLGQLGGFPFESTVSVSFTGDLKPETVTPQTVLAFDVTNPAAPTPVQVTPEWVPTTKSIVVRAPSGGWTRAHKYAFAVVGGDQGLRGAAGEPVIGSSSWLLVSGTTPLITCQDPKNLDTCTLSVDVIHSEEHDEAAKLRDEKTKALQLEQIRKGYAPLLDALTAQGLDRSKIPQIWTFTVVDAGEVTFDPANKVIPFPNDVLRDPQAKKVKLPNPKTGQPLTAADCQTTDTSILLYCGLNTLDGFSTIAPPISENSDKLGAVAQATVAQASLNTTNVGLLPLLSEAPKEIRTKPQYTPCLNCVSSKDANGNPQTSPQQLQWKLDAPLDEKTTYVAYVTTDPKDDAGKNVIPNPAFALVRSSAPLVENGRSAVSVLSDDQANQLEPLRVAYKPMFDVLETLNIHRENIALAFPFTTQSESTVLDQLQAVPSKAAGLPDTPLAALQDVSAGYPAIPNVAEIFGGVIVTPVLVTGPGGTFNPANPALETVRFTIAIPTGALPAGGWPVTIFGHGFTRWRHDFAALAGSAVAAGQAVIAIDTLFHGERSSCTGAKLALKQASDDAACADPGTMKCDEGTPRGLCVLRDDGARAACTPGPQGDLTCLAQNQGRCAADSKCQGAGAGFLPDANGMPAISGWNLLNPGNLFASRDNLRQQVIDLAQLVRVIKSSATGNLGAQLAAANGDYAINPARINYVGQSLGGIQGALFNAVSPDTHNVALNVPGGTWSALLLNTVTFKPLVDPLYQALAAQGINPGSPAFDQFIATLQWVLDPADPTNVAYRLTHSVDLGSGVLAPPQDRRAFIQFIEGDQAVPNVSTLALLQGANRSFSPVPPQFACAPPLYCYEFTEKGETFDAATATPDTRHGFLLKPPAGTAGLNLTTKAQQQVATFLATGALP